MNIPHDFHLHTNLSRCGQPTATPEAQIAALEAAGIQEACFTDHTWDTAVPGGNSWYAGQTVERLLPLRERLQQLQPTTAVKLHFGCETELQDDGTVGLHPDHASLFEFILIPHNHFNFAGLTRPADLTDSAEIARLLVRHFRHCCDTVPFAFAFAHPFTPIGYFDRHEEILNLLTDKELDTCFAAAAARGASIEFNVANLLRKTPVLTTAPASLRAQYKRMYEIAVACGCRFHLGGDEHAPAHIGAENYRLVRDFARECGAVLQSPLV